VENDYACGNWAVGAANGNLQRHGASLNATGASSTKADCLSSDGRSTDAGVNFAQPPIEGVMCCQ
jgi:hypothetical protein